MKKTEEQNSIIIEQLEESTKQNQKLFDAIEKLADKFQCWPTLNGS